MLFICFYPTICFALSIGSSSLSSIFFSGTYTVREHNWYWLWHDEVCQSIKTFCLRKKEWHLDIIHCFYTHIVLLRILLVYGQIFIFIHWRETGLCMFKNLWQTWLFSAESLKKNNPQIWIQSKGKCTHTLVWGSGHTGLQESKNKLININLLWPKVSPYMN